MDVLSAGLSGGLGLAGSALNFGFNSLLAAQQNAYNINMWKMQNEYNSPVNQMRRYEEAGLNPALMYGQVTPGNSSAAPQQTVPAAPNVSQDMRDLAKAFNVEGLKQLIADTKLKQANAKAAQVAANEAQDEYKARRSFGNEYVFDPKTGKFVPSGNLTDEDTYSNFVRMRELSSNYRTNSLLVPRGNLIGSQASLNAAKESLIPNQNYILFKRGEMFGPQLRMLDYQSKHYPWAFWIGNVKQGLQGVAPFIVPFL